MFKKSLIFLLLIFFNTATFASLRVQVDKDNLASDQMLTVVISSHDHISISPDLSPLKKDFYVVGTSQSSQFNIINGVTQMETQWQIALLPKHPGDLVLPSLQVGKEKTAARIIHVTQASANQGASRSITRQKDIFIDATVIPKGSYIQEQFVYTLKLYYNRSIENPYLIGPDLADAKISQNGQDIIYTTVKNGKYYRVLERSYLIMPKNVGHFQIQPPVLKGYVEQAPNMVGVYGLSAQTMQPIKVIGPSIDIEVKAKPSSFTGQWLPAKKLTLHDSWAKSMPSLREGEPATRIIEVNVEGATGEQIPPLMVSSIPNVNIYPGQPKRETNTNSTNQLGKLEQQIVYIPTAGGRVTIPAIKVHWWNSNAKKEEMAVIPRQSVNVLPALIKTPATSWPKIKTSHSKGQLQGAESNQNANITAGDKNLFWPIIAILFVIIWLLTVLLWRRQIKLTVSSDNKKINLKSNVAERERLLKAACLANNAKQARKHFLAWAGSYWQNPSLHALTDVVSILNNQNAVQLNAEIMQLEAVFYSKNRRNWNGATFWTAFQAYVKSCENKVTTSQGDLLPPLYFSE